MLHPMIFNLFKYYKPKYNNEDNLSFYTKGSFYFQKPIMFNDPWDCKAPPIKVPIQLNLLKNIWFELSKKSDANFSKTEWEKIKTRPCA